MEKISAKIKIKTVCIYYIYVYTHTYTVTFEWFIERQNGYLKDNLQNRNVKE
jgi:hypothetical protein